MTHPPPSRRAGPDACPGVLQVHAAADGGLARVRVPGGWLTGAQLRALADFTATGGLDITSRGNLQVRGLPPGAETALAARLAEVGLLPSVSHERVRNIVASPLSGRDGRGVVDVRPLVRELDAALCADPALAELPGRFLFALDDGRGDVAGLGADVALYGDAILLAGHDSGVRVPPDGAVAAMLAAARAFLADRTDEWRLAELLGRDPSYAKSDNKGPFLAGMVRQADQRVAVAAVAPLGELTSARVGVLAELPSLCVTPWRGVVIPDLPDDSLRTDLARVGFATDPDSPWIRVTACAGKPGCARSRADVRADALAVHTGQPAPERPAHWVGCERACGRPTGDHTLVLATEDGYRWE